MTIRCSICTFDNSNDKASCVICFSPLPAKSPSQWACKACTFLNESSANSCIICSTAKPGGVAVVDLRDELEGEVQSRATTSSQPKKRNAPPEIRPMKKRKINAKIFFDDDGELSRSMYLPPSRSAVGSSKCVVRPSKPLSPIGTSNQLPNRLGSPRKVPLSKENQAPETDMSWLKDLFGDEICSLCERNTGYAVGCSSKHHCCGACLKKYLARGIEEKKFCAGIPCPMPCCSTPLPAHLFSKSGLSAPQISELNELQETLSLAELNTLECPQCNEKFEGVSGTYDPETEEKNEKGEVLSETAKKHKAEFRFRCPKCVPPVIFCKKCNAVPYHEGYTCEEASRREKARKCRFCQDELTSANLAPNRVRKGRSLQDVCTKDDCVKHAKKSCTKVLPCGHLCRGVKGEKVHLCLEDGCEHRGADCSGEDYCNICWVEGLNQAPTVKLKCGHCFHLHCVESTLERKWVGSRMLFSYLDCPLCKREIRSEQLQKSLKKHYALKTDVIEKAKKRVHLEGLNNDDRLKDKSSKYYNNLEKFALDRLAFYQCHKCKKPYFGGLKRCEDAANAQSEDFDETHLVCQACKPASARSVCKVHGTEYIMWKCRFCCSFATFFCWGKTHFCDSCHKRQNDGDYMTSYKKKDLPKCLGKDCPIGGNHRGNGSEFCLGCSACR